MDEEDDIASDVERSDKAKGSKTHVSIGGPMFVWVLLLVIALIIKILIANSGLFGSSGSVAKAFTDFANLVLFVPGNIILPLLVGAIIGAEVGLRTGSMKLAQTGGLLNGLYAAVVYAVAIIIIYEIMIYVLPQAVLPLPSIATNLFAIPIIIVIITSLLFAVLSYSRRIR